MRCADGNHSTHWTGQLRPNCDACAAARLPGTTIPLPRPKLPKHVLAIYQGILYLQLHPQAGLYLHGSPCCFEAAPHQPPCALRHMFAASRRLMFPWLARIQRALSPYSSSSDCCASCGGQGQVAGSVRDVHVAGCVARASIAQSLSRRGVCATSRREGALWVLQAYMHGHPHSQLHMRGQRRLCAFCPHLVRLAELSQVGVLGRLPRLGAWVQPIHPLGPALAKGKQWQLLTMPTVRPCRLVQACHASELSIRRGRPRSAPPPALCKTSGASAQHWAHAPAEWARGLQALSLLILRPPPYAAHMHAVAAAACTERHLGQTGGHKWRGQQGHERPEAPVQAPTNTVHAPVRKRCPISPCPPPGL